MTHNDFTRALDSSPFDDLYGLALAVANLYRTGRDYGGSPLPQWMDADVATEAVDVAVLRLLADVDADDLDRLADEPEVRQRIVGTGKAILRTWAINPALAMGGGSRAVTTGHEDATFHEGLTATDALAALREVQEEARAVLAELPEQHAFTLDAMAGRIPRPAVAEPTWRKRCERARQALAEVLKVRAELRDPGTLPTRAPSPALPWRQAAAMVVGATGRAALPALQVEPPVAPEPTPERWPVLTVPPLDDAARLRVAQSRRLRSSGGPGFVA